MKIIFLFYICILMIFSGCSTANNQSDNVNIDEYIEYHSDIYASGKASYYADKFQGRKTASGEVFDQNKKTAAHRSLPFGTRLKITNIKNNKSVIVRVNDRGPYSKRILIDLSKSAFAAIGNTRSGIINVRIEKVGP
ncbi:septal ring lytic transglycosylase RlpA family protein [Maridesulfovibrio bastinii]|uniref:septal ring lytic transglycosylase RlpA family protein n=1 Tax=Maridesulfovibrio bastinii TaxID=47157 RepID=UPI0003F97803|nr:septal ring lytic transglycosylase RlpA family protein [Maridesulfovibrio bastinii]